MNEINDTADTYKTREVLLKLVTAALFDAQRKDEAAVEALAGLMRTLSASEWEAVMREADSQGVLSLIWPLAGDPSGDFGISIPGDVTSRWSQARNQQLSNSIRNVRASFDLHRIFSEAKIPCVIIKGLASGSYYPDYMTRTYGDVDIMVHKEDGERADSLMQSKGYRFISDEHGHLVYKKNGMTYELHTGFTGAPDALTKDDLGDFFSDMPDKAVLFDGQREGSASFLRTGSSACMIPSPLHHGVMLLAHKAKHMRIDGVGLRHLCDWAVFVGSMEDSFFENELQPVLKKVGLWRFGIIVTDLCSEYLGLRKCSWAGTTGSAYLAQMMSDVMSSGEFGIKASSAVTTARRHAAHKVSHGERGFLRVFINMMGDSARAAFPIIERRPLLLPAGWIYVGARHIVRMARGERSAHEASELFRQTGSRRAIFDEWRLFEAENDD